MSIARADVALRDSGRKFPQTLKETPPQISAGAFVNDMI